MQRQITLLVIFILLTPWNTVLLEKLTFFQPVKKFSLFYGGRRFITAFTSARHMSLSWASSIQSIPPHPTSWRSIVILSSNLRLGEITIRKKTKGHSITCCEVIEGSLLVISLLEWAGWSNATARPLHSHEIATVPTVEEIGWIPMPVWRKENLFSHWDSNTRTVQPIVSPFIQSTPSRRPTRSSFCYFWNFWRYFANLDMKLPQAKGTQKTWLDNFF